MSNPEKKNRHLNLFPKKKDQKKKIDNKAFDLMTAAADKTDVDVLAKGKESSTKGIHNALLAAGMTPAYGNIADVADATLYALEGEFGEAAWSMAAAIPVVGQMVRGKKALKVAKEAGEEMVTMYRGIDKWYPGKMVKKGKFVGGERYGKGKKLWVTTDIKTADIYNPSKGESGWKNIKLEFEVPLSYVKKHWYKPSSYYDSRISKGTGFFAEGLPKEFLKKVHK